MVWELVERHSGVVGKEHTYKRIEQWLKNFPDGDSYQTRLLVIAATGTAAICLVVLGLTLIFGNKETLSQDILIGILGGVVGGGTLRLSYKGHNQTAARLLVGFAFTATALMLYAEGHPGNDTTNTLGLLLSAILATALLGRRSGWITLGIASLFYILLNVLWLHDYLPEPNRPFNASEVSYLTITWIFIAMLIMIVIDGALNSLEKRTKATEALMESNQRAENTRRELETLRLSLDKEKEMAQLREQLMLTIAHEIRTPLAVIKMSNSFVHKYWERVSSQKLNEKMKTVDVQVNHLNKMLDNLNLVVRARRNYLEYQPQAVDAATFCETLINEMESIIKPSHQLSFRKVSHVRPSLLDQDLLRHILTNLLTNAIKYSPDGGKIILNLGQEDQQLIFQISDEGVGIPPENQAQMFKPFYRAQNVGMIRGVGLGLAIVKEAVDLHDGEIHCESTVDKGTTFTIVLPVRPVDEIQPVVIESVR